MSILLTKLIKKVLADFGNNRLTRGLAFEALYQ